MAFLMKIYVVLMSESNTDMDYRLYFLNKNYLPEVMVQISMGVPASDNLFLSEVVGLYLGLHQVPWVEVTRFMTKEKITRIYQFWS